MKIEIRCRKCGVRQALPLGEPAPGQSVQEFLHLWEERLRHQPSFGCFGGHFELRPPVPEFWVIDWNTLSEDGEEGTSLRRRDS